MQNLIYYDEENKENIDPNRGFMAMNKNSTKKSTSSTNSSFVLKERPISRTSNILSMNNSSRNGGLQQYDLQRRKALVSSFR